MFKHARVLRRFFKKMLVPVGFLTYAFVVGTIISYAKLAWGDGAAIAVLAVTVGFPFIGFFVYMIWQDATAEIENEDRDLMRRLRD
jgi:hypothetical protein